MTRKTTKAAADTCGGCAHAHVTGEGVHVCYRFPPGMVVLDGKPVTMRASVQATDRACGEFKRRLHA